MSKVSVSKKVSFASREVRLKEHVPVIEITVWRRWTGLRQRCVSEVLMNSDIALVEDPSSGHAAILTCAFYPIFWLEAFVWDFNDR